MAFRLYIVPMVGSGTKADPIRPKYFTDGSIAPVSYNAMPYGPENWALVGADLPSADDDFIVAQPDGMALPFDLSQQLTGGQVTVVQNKLEAINLPADWVTTAFTWKEVVRIVAGVMCFMQRFGAINLNTLFAGAVTLDDTIGSLSANVRNNLAIAADTMRLDRTGVTGSTTLRQVLRSLGQQLKNRPLDFGDVVV